MPSTVFVCPEESSFYADCLYELLAGCCCSESLIHEFGSGDGKPMIDALLRSGYPGVVHGYEIHDESWKRANYQIRNHRIGHRYQVHHDNFFDVSGKSGVATLVANPPYLPAWNDTSLYVKGLYGGTDGSMISRKLLSIHYSTVLLMLSSFSNPAGILQHASEQGYSVMDFRIKPIPFGRYSSQQEVKTRINELFRENHAFFSSRYYLLAGVIFQKVQPADMELSADLKLLMQSLR